MSIKTNFPIFKNQKKLVYLDNGATTQICSPALKAMENYNTKFRSNVHRGVYDIAEKATAAYENARDQIAKFINADREEIIFTAGTTHGLNLVAHSISPRLSHRDNVVLSRLEHHANLVPWQQMAKHYGFEIRFIELNSDFNLDLPSAKAVIDKNTKVVSFSMLSNVLGAVTPAKEIVKLAKSVRALTILDAAQAVAHLPIDVKKLDCDFLAFSGHKMYGPNGIGVLYGKRELLEEALEPFFFGGDMVRGVSYQNATWNNIPYKFEAGTPNIAGAIGLGAAARYILTIGWKKIETHEKELTKYALKKLTSVIKVFGSNKEKNRSGIISFAVPGVHTHDVVQMLGNADIAARAGFHCAEPLHELYGYSGSVRLSFGIYNDKKDIDKAVKILKDVKKKFV